MSYRNPPEDLPAYRATPGLLQSFAEGVRLWWRNGGREATNGLLASAVWLTTIVGIILLAVALCLCLEGRPDKAASAAYAGAYSLIPGALVLLTCSWDSLRRLVAKGRASIEAERRRNR